jgi:outer membrane protein OmpU
MKKILLGTSALVLLAGVASAQQVTTKAPFTVTLGGSVRSDFVIVNDDLANQESREARIDYRLTVKAEAKAENGLVYGFSGRLRNNQNGSNQATQDSVGMDEKWVYMGGSWGQVQFGDAYAADTRLAVRAPAVGIGQADYQWGTSLGNYRWVHVNEGEVDTKVSYMSPVFSGFQAGISYTPEMNSHGRDNARSKFVTGADNKYSDLISIGASYAGSFSDVGVKLGGGVQFGDAKDTSAVAKSTLGDYTVWQLGAQVSYAGFTFGAHYSDAGDTLRAKGDEFSQWGIGLTYAVGPWGVGLNYARTDTDPAASNAKNTTDYMIGIGGAYQLAPGLSLQADIAQFEAESVTSGLKAGQTKNDGTLFTFRTRLDF